MRKYLAVFGFELKSEWNFKANYIFSCLSFAIHIFVFNALWDYILQGKDVVGYSRTELIWYIIVGEFIAYSIGRRNYIKVSDMIKNGDVANILIKPLSFLKYIFALEATTIVNIVINFIFGTILGIVLAGKIEINLVQFILFMISVSLGLLTSICISVFIGMLAFITEENKSFQLVISKAMLLLVFTPLEFFPLWTQRILSVLPTTYVVYPPAKILVNFELKNALQLICFQVISLTAMMLANYFLNLKGVKNINVNGG